MAEAGSATKAKTASGETSARTSSRTTSAKRTAGATTKTRARPAAKSAARTTAARTKPSGAKAAAKKPSETMTAAQRRREAHAEERMDVPVPVLTPKMKVMHIPMPGMSYVGDARRLLAGYLPPPERLAFYGGLGLAAVFGAIDWPVAAAIGVGTMIARRGRGVLRTRPSAQQTSRSRS